MCHTIVNDLMSRERKIFQNPASLRGITILNFANISKIFANTIKVIYLEVSNKNVSILAPLLKLLNSPKY